MNITNLRYADDTVLIAEAESTLQDIVDKTTTASQEKGLDLNIKKTVCMITSKNAEGPVCCLESQGDNIKQVNTFKYLGCRISAQRKCLPEVKTRIALAKDAFNKLKPIMKDKNISLTTKMRMLEDGAKIHKPEKCMEDESVECSTDSAQTLQDFLDGIRTPDKVSPKFKEEIEIPDKVTKTNACHGIFMEMQNSQPIYEVK